MRCWHPLPPPPPPQAKNKTKKQNKTKKPTNNNNKTNKSTNKQATSFTKQTNKQQQQQQQQKQQPLPPRFLNCFAFTRCRRRRPCSHTSLRRSPTMVTLHDTQFVECRWWDDGWTVKTVVTCRSSASMIPAPGLANLQKTCYEKDTEDDSAHEVNHGHL